MTLYTILAMEVRGSIEVQELADAESEAAINSSLSNRMYVVNDETRGKLVAVYIEGKRYELVEKPL